MNKNNLIEEGLFSKKYTSTDRANSIAKKIKNYLKNNKKEILLQFDNFFVKKEYFSFDNFFKEEPDIDVNDGGNATDGNSASVQIFFTYSKKLTYKEKIGLLIGSGDPDDEGKKGEGGIFFNKNFKVKLNNIGIEETKGGDFEEEEEDNDDEEKYEDEWDNEKDADSTVQNNEKNEKNENIENNSVNILMDKYLNLLNENVTGEFDSEQIEGTENIKSMQVIFSFYKFDLADNKNIMRLKPSQRANPDFVDKAEGKVIISFNNDTTNSVEVGSITYYPRRTEGMNPPEPPPSLKKQMKELWTKKSEDGKIAASDYGILGSIFGNGMSKLGKKLFGEVLQHESISVSLEDNFHRIHNERFESDKKRNDLIDNSSSRAAAFAHAVAVFFENLSKNELADKDISITIEKVGETKYEVSINKSKDDEEKTLNLKYEVKLKNRQP